MNKVCIIAGGIGAGKTTFAKKNFQFYTDYDDIGSKKRQCEITLALFLKGYTVGHITTFPSEYEMKSLIRKIPNHCLEFYWLDTPIEECLENVEKRGRERDLNRKKEIVQTNTELLLKRSASLFPWRNVKYNRGDFYESKSRKV